jgi:hypothetical protein
MEPGWPVPGRSESGMRSLAAALSSFRHAEVVVTGPTGPAWSLLAPLWGATELVTAGSAETGAALRAAGARAVRICDPYEGAHPPLSLSPGAVSPLEHGELMLRVRGRRLLGALARKMLGRREPAVRAYLGRPLLWARRARWARQEDRPPRPET